MTENGLRGSASRQGTVKKGRATPLISYCFCLVLFFLALFLEKRWNFHNAFILSVFNTSTQSMVDERYFVAL